MFEGQAIGKIPVVVDGWVSPGFLRCGLKDTKWLKTGDAMGFAPDSKWRIVWLQTFRSIP